MDKQKYEKGGSAGSKGCQFQVRLLVVFLLNALRMRFLNWRLSTEDKRAGKFDDVVLEWSEGAVLLQAKHKENGKRITVEHLMSTTLKNNDFSIPKYFLSYQKVKSSFPTLKKAVICTNASVNERALKFLTPQPESPDSVIFWGSDTSLFYTLNDDILSELKDLVKTYYNQSFRGKEVDESVVSDGNLKEFQTHFQIYFDYPSGNVLENVIEQLLDRTSWHAKASASEIYSKVMEWFQQKGGKFLTELYSTAMVSEIKRDKYWQSLKQYDVHFPSDDINFTESNRRYHFIVDGTCLLQEIRIWHAMRGIGKNVLYIHPDDSIEDQKQLIEAFELDNYIVLIIVQPSESVVMELWDQIEEILYKYQYKKIVMLTARLNRLVPLIESGSSGYDVTKELPTFDDLLEDTRNRLLKSNKIFFQGDAINLEELFAPESIWNHTTYLGSEILEALVRGNQIRVGSKLSVLEEEVERCYIPRHFVRRHEKWHETNIFEVNDKLILITESAGMGKTTILTKLAGLIKENNPHLWVIKIILDHYSIFLKNILQRPRGAIDITEFLDSQEATKLTNQLDKLVFSMHNKVVLMLDGVDEISPTYTELVTTLLDNCLKAPNIMKIFVTTRPHLAEKLEEKFQVKSFVLEPFSERNQVDFLRKHWMCNLGHTINREKCEQYAEALVRMIPSWTNSYIPMDSEFALTYWKPHFDMYDDFAAIPQHLKMLAEIFQENGRIEGVVVWQGCKEFLNTNSLKPNLPQEVDLTKLYKLFIEKKKYLYINRLNRGGSAGGEKIFAEQFEKGLAFHRMFALKVIVGKRSDLFLCYKESARKWMANTLEMGIIQKVNNTLHFIHRTFAEYFVAQSLIIELKRHNQKTEFQRFLIEEVLLNRQFNAISTFFDGLLRECEKDLPHNIFQSYQCLSYYIDLSDYHYFDTIHELAGRGLVATLRLLLKCVNFKIVKGKETSVEQLRHKINKKKWILRSRYFGNRLKILQYFVQRGGINFRNLEGRTPLHEAASRGHLEMVKFLVRQGANINATYGQNPTPLCEAVARGHSSVMEFLVEQGADIIASIRQGGSELYEAISSKCVHIVNYLLEQIVGGGSLEHGLNSEYAMIPFIAAYLGRIDIIRFLVERGMDVNSNLTNQQSLIFGAAMGEHLNAVEYLVQQGGNINSRDVKGNTALHIISEKSSLTCICKFLVDSGIDIDVKNGYGLTALHVAVGAGARSMAEFLIKCGADVNSMDASERHSVLHTAALKNHLAIVELLGEHGADVNVKNSIGNTLLHSCTEWGRLDVVKCLVKFGVDVTIRDKNGRSALRVALLENRLDVAKYLVECVADVNSKDHDGQTELHFAVSMIKKTITFFEEHGLGNKTPFHDFSLERLDMVKHLVEHGANFNLKNNEDQTVLYLAILNVVLNCSIPFCDRCLLVIKFLIEQGAAVDTESSKGDAKEMLAKEIQKHVRYFGHSLDTILRLPVFRLLDPASPLNRKSATPSIQLSH